MSICSFAFMGGCVEKLTTVAFSNSYSDTFSTKAYPGNGPIVLSDQIVNSDVEKTLKDNGASLDNLKELKINSASIEIELPAGGNFNAIDYVELYLSTASLPEIKVAFKNPVAKGATKVDLDVNSSDLAPYLKSPQYHVIFKGSNNSPLPPMRLKYNTKYDLKASL
ncbi:MAG: hypothetical protein H7321_08875 [Bacteroidia bacterium]|nr:hypothetical protein [Bacteroidia bacterium]